ncbi:MAG: cytidylate kinase-like family protein, partial [Candidatus Eremiobacteraeota bacterium]|nr:cytidylate kinase-like family protein [Candidatus Eremiobacteraeota bacterium]
MIVTISNEYGSGALAIAQRSAGALGYDYVDRQLPVVVAKRLRVSPEAVEATEDAARSLGERLLTGLERATPELAEASTVEPFDDELLRAVQDAVREYASRGNAVIVGRGSSAILGPGSDVLRVFFYAPREWRIAHVMRTAGIRRESAESELDRVDRARSAYMKAWYG